MAIGSDGGHLPCGKSALKRDRKGKTVRTVGDTVPILSFLVAVGGVREQGSRPQTVLRQNETTTRSLAARRLIEKAARIEASVREATR